MFNKDWMYLNLQSDLGCPVTVTVHFKSEFTAIKTQGLPRGLPMDATSGSFEKSIGSPKAPPTSSLKVGDPNAESFDFGNWSLGNGKIREKRVKLDNFLSKLMDKNNKKFRRDHLEHCSKFQSTPYNTLLCRGHQEKAK